MKNIKAVLFDRDGVLINSEIANVQASFSALRSMDVEISPNDESIIIGKHPLDYVDSFVAKYGVGHDEFLQKWSGFYEEMLSQAEIFDDTIDFLNKVQEHGYRTALVTSADRETTERTLSNFKLLDRFETIVTFDDVTKRKPDPEPYLTACSNLGLAPDDCLVIEDSLPGVLAAKSAKMKCVVRINDFTKNIDFSAADLVVANVEEVWTHFFSEDSN